MNERDKDVILCGVLGFISITVGVGWVFGIGAALIACGAFFLSFAVMAS